MVGPWSDLGRTLVGPWSDLGRTLVGPWPDLCRTLVGPWSDLGRTLVRPWLDLRRTLAGRSIILIFFLPLDAELSSGDGGVGVSLNDCRRCRHCFIGTDTPHHLLEQPAPGHRIRKQRIVDLRPSRNRWLRGSGVCTPLSPNVSYRSATSRLLASPTLVLHLHHRLPGLLVAWRLHTGSRSRKSI